MPMDMINLPNPKDCELDHQYIAQHLTQPQMDPTLCSKCSPITKYFCSPEPVAQELNKKSCSWKQVPESTLSMNIEPYKDLQTPYYNTENLGIQHGLPSLQRTILTYRLPTSSPLADLSCYYKISLIDPLGSLMSAVWLQGDPDSKFPFLDPNSHSPLQLWIFRSPKFGFKVASSLAAAGKNMRHHFYNQYFPEGMHKLSPKGLKIVIKTLKKAYSDDVLSPIFLTRIEEEERNPTFKHPDNWSTLTIEEKGYIMAIVLQPEIIGVADFSSHFFKEVSSPSKSGEEDLNKDTRLDLNKATEQIPELE